MNVLAKFSKSVVPVLRRGQVFTYKNVARYSSLVDDDKASWISRLLVRKIDTGKESHSRLLADKDTVYEMQIHAVKPEDMQEYLEQYEGYVGLMTEKQTGAELAGSWTVEIGDQDEAIHLWKYPGGYPGLNSANQIYRTDKDFIDYRISRNKMLRSRKNQILLAFSFWGDIQPREGKWIYELRSYTLKPGTMIEWGNNWAKGIKARFADQEPVAGYFSNIGEGNLVHHIWGYYAFPSGSIWFWAKGIKSRMANNEPVAGFFSQIGEVYQVHHVWAYESLQSRKEVREAAWRRPGWDECVAYTVPLIRHMTARILIPTPFSPLQ